MENIAANSKDLPQDLLSALFHSYPSATSNLETVTFDTYSYNGLTEETELFRSSYSDKSGETARPKSF